MYCLKKLSVFSVLLFSHVLINPVLAQSDSLIFVNGEHLIGRVKDLTRGVLKVETDYSKSDFQIKWIDIDKIYLRHHFVITLKSGRVVTGAITSTTDDRVIITDQGGVETTEMQSDVVYLREIDAGFWDRLSASIDIGFSLTKANNVRTFTSRTGLGYVAERWSASATFNGLTTKQDSVSEVDRDEILLNYRYIFPRGQFATVQQNFLSNTEQRLDLRSTSKLGIGHFIVRTNASIWSIEAGGAYVRESFDTGESDDRETWEGYFSTELNLFDIGDLSFRFIGSVYPSLTAEDRVRVDLNTDVKYNLPLDFYIRVGVSLNFDNRPIEGASKSDYVLQTSVGWKF